MLLDSDDTLMTLSGVVTVEEAEPLLDWLLRHPNGRIDVQAVTHLHTAVLQVFLAAKPTVVRPFSEPFLLDWVAPLLADR